jgi:hypothetical protein
VLVFALGLVFLLLILPLAAFAALARTTWAGLALVGALLACGAGWLSLMAGWLAPDLVANTVLALAILTPALIMAGRLPDRVAVLRQAPPARVRLITGHSLAAVCVCLNVLVIVVVIMGALFLGWPYTPPSSDALPLPPTLTVVSDRDLGCPDRALDRCQREIDVTSPADLSLPQTAQIVTAALARLHGWHGLGPYQGSCHSEGWLLGRETVCVQVETAQNTVQVLLESSI